MAFNILLSLHKLNTNTHTHCVTLFLFNYVAVVLCQTHIVNPEEAEGHHMSTPFGTSAACTAAGRDAAAIKHDGHIVGSFRLTGLTGHHCSTEMEA